MAKVQEIFDITIRMMDEQSEETGSTITEDTQEYHNRTISIINAIMPSIYPYTKDYDSEIQCPFLSGNDFQQEIPFEDNLAIGVLPYALAAHLLAAENEELAAWFLNRYNSAFYEIRNRNPSTFSPIETPYGLF